MGGAESFKEENMKGRMKKRKSFERKRNTRESKVKRVK